MKFIFDFVKGLIVNYGTLRSTPTWILKSADLFIIYDKEIGVFDLFFETLSLWFVICSWRHVDYNSISLSLSLSLSLSIYIYIYI